MEKYSAYRDPGTGIQPFLPPVPPHASESIVQTCLKPINFTLGLVRMLLIAVIGAVYVLLVYGICLPLSVVPPLADSIAHATTALLSRLCLLVLGFLWINVEQVTRKRGRALPAYRAWAPGAGDIIISNWLSYVEVLWLAFRLNPTFVLPIAQPAEVPSIVVPVQSPLRNRAGASSASKPQYPMKNGSDRANILGFRTVSLLEMLNTTGRVPPYGANSDLKIARSIEDIRSSSRRAIVVLPECTTSNGRGLLRFAQVFKGVHVPVRGFKVFIMSVRIDPPTQFSPTITNPIPSRIYWLNPLPHMFTLASSFFPHNLSIRVLALSDSPSSESFVVSNVIPPASGESADNLSEICATLVGEIGRMKRVALGWEEKSSFLDLYRAKTR